MPLPLQAKEEMQTLPVDYNSYGCDISFVLW